MTDYNDLRMIARADTRNTLAHTSGFQALEPGDQVQMFRQMYTDRLNSLAQSAGSSEATPPFSQGMAGARRTNRVPGRASDLIDDSRHTNQRIDQAGELAGEFVDEVDFPGFVKELLTGVFDANLKVTLEQMEAYQKLLKTATQSVSKFVNAIDDTAAFGYLAENNSDEFNFDFDGEEQEEDGSPKAVLTDKDGNRLDIGDNEVKAKIMEAKITMAKEQRLLLRETILMGITRLVVEKGVVKASVLFDIKAGEKIDKRDKAAMKESMSKTSSVSGSTGLIGKIFGGGGGGHTTARKKTKISISSAKSQATTDLAAKLAGSVDITFKSDYFKLDNFANLFGDNQPPVAQPAGTQPVPATAPVPAR